VTLAGVGAALHRASDAAAEHARDRGVGSRRESQHRDGNDRRAELSLGRERWKKERNQTGNCQAV
jgi:hypothetical protein